jgi:hypothetical protein
MIERRRSLQYQLSRGALHGPANKFTVRLSEPSAHGVAISSTFGGSVNVLGDWLVTALSKWAHADSAA